MIKHVTLLLASSIFLSAQAKENLTFDYTTASLCSVGIYNPKQDGEVTGLKAEMIARKNGVENIEKYLESSCSGIDKSALSIKPDWHQYTHSNGTEIYINSILTISLETPIKNIFRIPSAMKKPLKTDEGDKVAFELPKDIPSQAIRCGTLDLTLNGKDTNHILPIETIDEKTPHLKIIHLVYDPKSSRLEINPALKIQETEILNNSTFADMDASDVIAVAVASTNQKAENGDKKEN